MAVARRLTLDQLPVGHGYAVERCRRAGPRGSSNDSTGMPRESRDWTTAKGGSGLASSRHFCPILQNHSIYFVEDELAEAFLYCNGARVFFRKVTNYYNIFVV